MVTRTDFTFFLLSLLVSFVGGSVTKYKNIFVTFDLYMLQNKFELNIVSVSSVNIVSNLK